MNQELYPSTKIVVYDVETTGFTKSDEVIQFSAIVMNDTLYTESLVNFYCNAYCLSDSVGRNCSW